MKRAGKVVLTAVLMCAMVFGNSAIVLAAGSASNMFELAAAVTEAGLQRKEHIVVEYTGDENDARAMMPVGGDMDLFYGYMLAQDDPTTSDDADYLVGNMRFSRLFVSYENRDLVFDIEYFETLQETKYVNEHVGEILDQLGVADMSNYDKVKSIHDYICDLISYSNTGKLYENSAYGAIKYRKALCNAYSLCMYKLCVEAGIPCKYIGGYSGNGEDWGGHAWNIVALGDKWYYVDVTYDDTDDDMTYDYFLKGQEDFDESDPASYSHWKDLPYYREPFKDMFPIAREAFQPWDDDENRLITIGGTNPGNPDPEVEYKKSEISDGFYPNNGKIKIKKNRMLDLQISLKDTRAVSLVTRVTYRFTTGKNRVKKLKNYGIMMDEGIWFTDLEMYGKKKGKVAGEITLLLVNGQKLKYKFSGKVK